jgi:tetratricopeptide (TPR) repeat protein
VAAVRLPDDIGPGPGDLRFAVNGTMEANLIRANLSLISGSDKALLWSTDFERPTADRSALEDAIASAAGRALRCARDEASGEYGRLSKDLRPTYVNGCTALTESFGDAGSLVPQLRHVTEKAPNFRPAWARLLTAEADYVSSLGADRDERKAAQAAFRKDAAAARKIAPDMAEVTLAELMDRTLAPARRIEIVDQAKAQDPQNPVVLIARGTELATVGRMAEAQAEEDEAAKLDPLSPTTRVNQILATIFAGKIDRARLELAAAKRLWPDSAAVREAEYELVLRYGEDFEKISREMGYIGPGFEIYKNARQHPNDATIATYMAFMRRPENSARMFFALQGLGEANRPNEFYELMNEMGGDRVVEHDTSMLFRPWMASVRRDPRFMALAKRMGLVDYWVKSGHWPDFCADADLEYDCRTEASKLSR